MEAAQILREEFDENFLDTQVIQDDLRRHEVVSASISNAGFQSKSSVADSGCHVKAWVNQEFGDDEDASQMMHDEGNFHPAMREQVDEYLDTVDFIRSSTYSISEDQLAATFFSPEVDSEELEICYEPQLWCFT